jgi:hypothetical protein
MSSEQAVTVDLADHVAALSRSTAHPTTGSTST